MDCYLCELGWRGFVYLFFLLLLTARRAAFRYAQNQTSFEVIAIVPGEHPVYSPSLDE